MNLAWRVSEALQDAVAMASEASESSFESPGMVEGGCWDWRAA